MLRIIKRTVSNSGEHFADNEEGITVQIVGRSASHDCRAAQMPASKNDREERAAPFVNTEADSDTEEGVYLDEGQD